MRVILAAWEAEMRIMVQDQPRQIVCETPISKIKRAKCTGGVAQAAEHLLCKYEALSLNSSPTKKKKKKRERREEGTEERRPKATLNSSLWLLQSPIPVS
jgi:hypothetical protein